MIINRKDRTGEVAGSYNLKYNYHSWDEVMASNYAIGGSNDPISYINQRALTWYCYYLFYQQNYSLSCNNDNLSDTSLKKPVLLGWDTPSSNSYYDGYVAYLSLFYILLGFNVLMIVIVVVGFVIYRTKHRLRSLPILRPLSEKLSSLRDRSSQCLEIKLTDDENDDNSLNDLIITEEENINPISLNDNDDRNFDVDT